MAEWLRRGLQNLLHRFNSGQRLQITNTLSYNIPHAWVAELVYAFDLKSNVQKTCGFKSHPRHQFKIMKSFITTSIPYVNGPPHLGHAMEFVMADVLARYSRLKGDDVILSIGTDEHGGKIAEKAEKLNLTPIELANQMSAEFSRLAKTLEISNDRFIRTTDKDHEDRVQKIWTQIRDDLYKKEYTGWYCTGDEAFLLRISRQEK